MRRFSKTDVLEDYIVQLVTHTYHTERRIASDRMSAAWISIIGIVTSSVNRYERGEKLSISIRLENGSEIHERQNFKKSW